MTLFISEKIKTSTLRTVYIYIGVTIFIGIFGAVYEIFSHNVFSPAMYLAWIIPCTLGVFIYLLLAFIPMEKVPGLITACVYNFGVGMLTIRSIFIGVIEIYGTTNTAMLTTYTVLSIVFLAVGGSAYLAIIGYEIYKLIKRNKTKNNQEGV